jgi:gluconokinase
VVWETDDVDVPAQLWCYRVDGRRFVMGGALSNGGNLYAWLSRVLDLPADAEALLATRPAAGHGLTMLPLLAGERSPGYAANATARCSACG